MTARKKDYKSTEKLKFVLGAPPPQRLSKEDKELLLNLKPSKAMQERVSKMVKLPIVDGASSEL
jgi:hypothetical protein